MSERELQRRVMRMAKHYGWRRAHFKAAPLKNRGGRYVTPQDGEAGFPDCVFVRDGRLLFVELKAEQGVISDGQLAWLHELRQVVLQSLGAVRVFVWRPQDWDDGTIEEILK